MAKKSELRLGIVGAGMITRGSHLPAALGSSRTVVTALVDPIPARAEQLARDYGIQPRIYCRIEDALDDIDAAVIATPNDSHAAIAITCLNAEKGVLIEKPLASTYAEGQQILEAAERSVMPVLVGYTTRYRECIVLLKKLLDQHYFGKVYRFINRFGTPGGWSPLSAYNLNRQSAGGGVLMVTATHFLDRMLYFWGYPDKVWLEADSMDVPEANCRAHFSYGVDNEEYLQGLAIYSKTAKLPSGTVIETDAGYVLLGETDNSKVILRPKEAPSIEHIIQHRDQALLPKGSDSFQLQMDDFIAACIDGTPPLIGAKEGLRSLQLIETLYSNHRPLVTQWYPNEAFSS